MERIRTIYDAHLHFPMKFAEPYDFLKTEVIRAGVGGGLLIVNTDAEASVFWENLDKITHGDLGFVPDLAFYLDIHSKNWKCHFDKLDDLGVRYSVKLHPRLSNITLEDFDRVSDKLEEIRSKTIIVDNWIYGPKIKNHVGTQLTIYLAENYPERNIVMAHAGGVRILETMLLTRPLNNVYYDLAETCCYFVNTSVQKDIVHFLKYTKDKVMFGSDYPDFAIQKSIDVMMREMKEAGFTEEEKDMVMCMAAKTIYRGGYWYLILVLPCRIYQGE